MQLQALCMRCSKVNFTLQGLSESEARGRLWLFDSRGLIAEGRDGLSADKAAFAQPAAALKIARIQAGASIADSIKLIKPTCLIGATGKGGVFTQQMLEEMYRGMPRSTILQQAERGSNSSEDACITASSSLEGTFMSLPPASGSDASLKATPIVLPLSNPTKLSECTLQEALDATDGNVVFASGSPFPTALVNSVAVEASQANNAMIFPGVGAGALLSGATEIPESCFLAAGKALADELSEQELVQGLAIPPVARIRDAALAVASAVCVECQQMMTSSNNSSNSRVWRLAAAVKEAEKGAEAWDAESRRMLRAAIRDWRY
jgi:malate dehydrogenase (oxaloacetate-decarboxylating)(NADP+)